MNILNRHIRKISLKNSLIVFFPFLIMMIALFVLPFEKVLYPLEINYTTDIDRAFENGDEYITVTFPEIHYTGYTLRSSSKIKGYYYYYIANERIVFLLVSNYNCHGQEKLTNYTCTGRLTGWDKDLREVMNNYSHDLNFSITGLSSITYNCIINECKYHFYFYLYLLIYIGVISLLILTFIIYNIIIMIMPELHPSYGKFRKITKPNSVRNLIF